MRTLIVISLLLFIEGAFGNETFPQTAVSLVQTKYGVCERTLSGRNHNKKEGLLFQTTQEQITIKKKRKVSAFRSSQGQKPLQLSTDWFQESPQNKGRPQFNVLFLGNAGTSAVQIHFRFGKIPPLEYEVEATFPKGVIAPNLKISFPKNLDVEAEGIFIDGDWNDFVSGEKVKIGFTPDGREDFERRINNLGWQRAQGQVDQLKSYYEHLSIPAQNFQAAYKSKYHPDFFPHFMGTRSDMKMVDFVSFTHFTLKWSFEDEPPSKEEEDDLFF